MNLKYFIVVIYEIAVFIEGITYLSIHFSIFYFSEKSVMSIFLQTFRR